MLVRIFLFGLIFYLIIKMFRGIFSSSEDSKDKDDGNKPKSPPREKIFSQDEGEDTEFEEID
jgi:hypothetical protein